MKVRVSSKAKIANTAKIKSALRAELEIGSVISIASHPSKLEEFTIKLSPGTKQTAVRKICKKLNDTGYSTSIIWSGLYSPYCDPNNLHPYGTVRRHSPDRHAHIIVAKVNAPELPKGPIEFPSPEGKKPKKRK